MDPLTQAITAFKTGKPVIIMDDDTRENEGDVCLPAAAATPELVRFILRASTGLLCVACSPRRINELDLTPMVMNNTDPHGTPFTVSVDLDPKYGTTTGVSIYDRARTIQALADPTKNANDFTRPGHIFPLRASPQGLSGRRGHTEASVELCKLAGVDPVCLIAELMNEDGTMARLSECRAFAEKHELPLISINQIAMALTMPRARLPINAMDLTITTYSPRPDINYIVLSKGDLQGKTHVPLRIHSECLTGDVFGSQRCDCRSQLDQALGRMRSSEVGLLIYIRGHEGRGIGLDNKIRAYALQDAGTHDTCTANLALHLPLDNRMYTEIPTILERLGVQSVDIYTQNPHKIQAVGKYLGDVHPEQGQETSENHSYLEAKKVLMTSLTPPISRPKKIGLAYTRTWHTASVTHMVEQCRTYLKDYPLMERSVSGSFELTMGARALMEAGCDVVITLGILLKEETEHFDAVLASVTQGLTSLQLMTGKPVVFGILACYTKQQIEARVFGDKNHVKDWCDAAIDMLGCSSGQPK